LVFKKARENELVSLQDLKEDKREDCFSCLEKTDIYKYRDNIVHKDAYRPSLDEITSFDGLIKSLSWLGMYLKVDDSLSFLNERIQNI